MVNGVALNPDAPHLAALLGEAGYRTGYVGKWHLGDPQSDGPVAEADRGGHRDWLASNILEFTSDTYHTRLFDGDGRPHDLPGYRADAVADAGIRQLATNAPAARSGRTPFCLTLGFVEPHHQNDIDAYPPPAGDRAGLRGRWVPPDLAALPGHPGGDPAPGGGDPLAGGSAHRDLAGYFGMVRRLDAALGRVRDALHSLGLAEDTVLACFSDHGCHFKTRNAEYKRSGHEASIRVPMALTGGPFTGGGRIDRPVSLVDLAPTVLDAAGVAAPAAVQGRSLLGLVRRDPAALAAWPADAYSQIAEASWGRAVRSRRWKYIVHAADPPARANANPLSFDRYREAELYDLGHDPHELCNLARLDSHTPVREAMRVRLRAWFGRTGEPDAAIDPPERILPGGQRRVSAAEAAT